MRLIISRSQIESETQPNFYWFEAYFYFLLLQFIELLFVVFSLVCEARRLASVLNG